jgi:hypothetical protein
MSGKLITIATFNQLSDTQLYKTKIESEGTECFIVDERILCKDWLYPYVVGGIKIEVNETDVARAIEILHQTDFMEDVVSENNEPHCPNCNSSDVHYEKFLQRFGFTSWLHLYIPFPFLRKKWRCGKCGYRWKTT